MWGFIAPHLVLLISKGANMNNREWLYCDKEDWQELYIRVLNKPSTYDLDTRLALFHNIVNVMSLPPVTTPTRELFYNDNFVGAINEEGVTFTFFNVNTGEVMRATYTINPIPIAIDIV